VDCVLNLKEWSVAQDDKKKSFLTGTYELLAAGNSIAEQAFGGDAYRSKKIVFSKELLENLAELENQIKAELESLLK